jgi:hypothetical protein
LTILKQTKITGQKSSDNAEAIIYRGIIKGNAFILNIAKTISTIPTRIYLPSFPLNFRFATFRDSSGILLTIKRDRMMVKSISKIAELVKELKINDCELCPAITTEITARAFAGIGNPLKVVVWVESRLKTARRIAPHTGINAGIIIKIMILKTSEFKTVEELNERVSLRR